VTASRTHDGSYVNVRSEDCVAEASAAAPEGGMHVVTYGGEPYAIVGMYFARCHHGGRELWYVLGPTGASTTRREASNTR
jgi:hypothetical protein